MKKHIKILSLILAVLMLAISLTACKPDTNDEQGSNASDITVRVAGMTGPTGIGLVNLKSDSENGKSLQKYQVSFYKEASEIVPLLVKGELDIAAVPANLAAIQYSKNNGFIQVIAINNLGVLSVLEKGDTVKSVSDLKGKVIYAPASGKGAVPEYALNYILTQNGLDPTKDVTVEWKTEVTEIIASLKKTDSGIALLPQPAATNALNNVEDLREALNLNDEWNALSTDSKLVTGVIVVRTDCAKENPEVVARFLAEYERSARFANNNLEDTAKLVAEYGIAAEAIALKAIPKCNITFIKGNEMKSVLSAYLKTLYDANPASVGGSLPADGFYYVAE